MMAWGSLAREVPRRNFRSFCLVSSEKVYSLDSDDWGRVSCDGALWSSETCHCCGCRGRQAVDIKFVCGGGAEEQGGVVGWRSPPEGGIDWRCGAASVKHATRTRLSSTTSAPSYLAASFLTTTTSPVASLCSVGWAK